MSTTTPQPPTSYADFEKVADRVRNWGRWGDDDQIGALNFITPEIVKQSSALVLEGKVFPLGIRFDADGVWGPSGMRRNPIHLFSVDGGDSLGLGESIAQWPAAGPSEATFEHAWKGRTRFADDFIIMALQSATQWDALSHVWYDELLYNGYPAATMTSRGATRNGVENTLPKGIVSRAVLLDVARHRDVEHLPANSPILPEELDAVSAAQGVTVRTGDILLVRTGWWGTFVPGTDGAFWRGNCPGLHWSTASWMHEHEIAAVASDNIAVEVSGTHVDQAFLPLHMLCLRDMGVMLGEFWDLDALAADCATDGRYEFQVMAPPLNIPGAVGSPINPVALK